MVNPYKSSENWQASDNCLVGHLGDKRCFVHDDHRWVLPLIAEAQNAGLIPRPTVWLMFDQHRDDIAPACLDEIANIRAQGCLINSIVHLCDVWLRKLDDDWLKAGMELGLISHTIIFGATHGGISTERIYKDHVGEDHQIEFLGLPNDELSYQGRLSDLARARSLERVWELLGWSPGRGFVNNKACWTVDFDADLFVLDLHGITVVWPDEIFDHVFNSPSDYEITRPWTGKMFVQELIRRSGLLTVALEPECCNGRTNSRTVLDRLNHYVFDGELRILGKY